MRKLALALLMEVCIFLAVVFIWEFSTTAHKVVHAQVVYEIACPSGATPLPFSQSFNPVTGKFKAFLCIDLHGNVTFQTGGDTGTIAATACGALLSTLGGSPSFTFITKFCAQDIDTTAPDVTFYEQFSGRLLLNPPADPGYLVQQYDMITQTRPGNIRHFPFIVVDNSQFQHLGSGIVDLAIGTSSESSNEGPGTITSNTGMLASTNLISSGTTTVNEIVSAQLNQSGTSVLGVNYFFHAVGTHGGGTHTTNYGIRIEDFSGFTTTPAGNFAFYSAGTTQNHRFGGPAVFAGPITNSGQSFANLPASVNGTWIYCTDCNATCTAGASTGRTCFRENGAWTH